jgi:hypothetical protein
MEVELDDEVTLGESVAALRTNATTLEGRVNQPGDGRLTDHYSPPPAFSSAARDHPTG